MTYPGWGLLTQEPPQALFQLANAFLPPALPAFLFTSWEKSEFWARESAGRKSGAVGEGMLCAHRLSRLRSCLLVADPSPRRVMVMCSDTWLCGAGRQQPPASHSPSHSAGAEPTSPEELLPRC